MKALSAYSREVLAFAWPPAPGLGPPKTLDADTRRRHMERALRLAAHGGRTPLLLGAGTGELALELHRAAPWGCVVLETDLSSGPAPGPSPDHSAKQHRRDTLLALMEAGVPVLADGSAWALLLLLEAHGLGHGHRLAVKNPEEPPRPAHDPLALVERLLAAVRPLPPGEAREAPRPSLSVAAILAPDEPRLPEFFEHIPPWVREVSVVWDAPDSPSAHPCPAPLVQAARPLDGDFAAQRNAALGLCTGDWVLFLDGDERLAPEGWEAVRALAPANPEGGAAGHWLPRRTYLGDEAHVRAGYGLWPDLQLRLFPRLPGLAFQGHIHERLTGLEGPQRLAPGLCLHHFSHLWKDPQALARKLALFQTVGGAPHALSADYPAPGVELLGCAGPATALLQLPPMH